MSSLPRTPFSSYKSPRPAPVVSALRSQTPPLRKMMSEPVITPAGIQKHRRELSYDHFALRHNNYAVRQGHVGIQHDKLRSWSWTRRCWLVLDNVRLQFCPKQNVAPTETLMLHQVCQVERIDTKPYCLMVAAASKTWYLIFKDSVSLYDWYHNIRSRCPLLCIGAPTDFRHDLHVTYDSAAKEITGLPEPWIRILVAWGITPGVGHDQPQRRMSDISPAVSEPASSPVKPGSPSNTSLERRPTSRLRSASDATTSRRAPSIVPSVVTSVDHFRKSPHRYREVEARDLTGAVRTMQRNPSSLHENCDILKGEWTGSFGTRKVAIQVVRLLDPLSGAEQTRLNAIILREVKALHQLRHPNVVRTRGFCRDKGPIPVLISTWISGGNIREYYRQTPAALKKAEKLKLLTEVAAGLNYLHNFSRTIVHGDVRGANILITPKRTACLTGFGLNPILQELEFSPDPHEPHIRSFGTSLRWAAVEVILNGRRHISYSSDVFSFARTVLEVMTGKDPYHYLSDDAEAATTVLRGVPPRRPPVFGDDGLWHLLERCWKDMPTQRPSMALALLRLEEILNLHEHQSSRTPDSAPP